MDLAKLTKRLFAGPSIDGEVIAGNIGVAKQFRAEVFGRSSEEHRPGSVRSIGRFESSDLLLGNLELPDNNEHARPNLSSMVAHSHCARGGRTISGNVAVARGHAC